MKKRDLMFALLVVLVWGANFTVIKLGLSNVPPMLLAALRYVFTALPAIIFIKRPAVGWKYIVSYGLTVGVGQFSFLFYAISIGMPAGISSVVLQSQVFFTLIFASVILKESLNIAQIVGLFVEMAGLYFIGRDIKVNTLSSIPFEAFVLTLIAAAFWGISNIIIRYAAKQAVVNGERLDMLSMVVWSSIVAPGPFLAIALLENTPETLWYSMLNLDIQSLSSIFYLAFGATLFGYGMWSSLLAKYPTAKIAPISLLIPIVGIITAKIVLSENITVMQWSGCGVIILGLIISNIKYLSVQKLLKRQG